MKVKKRDNKKYTVQSIVSINRAIWRTSLVCFPFSRVAAFSVKALVRVKIQKNKNVGERTGVRNKDCFFETTFSFVGGLFNPPQWIPPFSSWSHRQFYWQVKTTTKKQLCKLSFHHQKYLWYLDERMCDCAKFNLFFRFLWNASRSL